MSEFPKGAPSPASIVDALKAVAGDPPKARASFAKGQCVHGTYIPSNQAEEITRSRSFTRPSRVLARFSVGDGDPNVADSENLVPRGFSFRLGNSNHRSDILAQDCPVHYARTLEQMIAFLEVRVPGPDGKLDSEKIRAFSAANPETLHQVNYIAARPPPASFASTTYWGVHCFPATNAMDETRFIKFKIAPVGGEVALTESPANTRSTDFLHTELKRRVKKGNMRFSVMALLDRPNDPIMDLTVRWPDEDNREAVRLGTIVITGIEPNEACDGSMFDPAKLAEGIGHPHDEIFAARAVAYAISLKMRR
ncbi:MULTISPECIES: catalase [unclassified Bradyrhizobium]|uniref:catalase n=1 Tax=unclassified Bradyrhizobium TaxID=2631580 RepID=UPI001BA7E94A|nr:MULTISPECIES: catalase [unclassified Bradyrhizobium]MBR1206068.1 catalase [Bradyrhizobium sp. AUGA SZCCT0124]MBR1314806.1 catalase [Bradyrhizobium sp. AUGA SZCCT0051]MBR1341777.1 catalase [Bradyrhizobium sp. AUGA SZCCT0105]MBR1358822.1 catalase [Bradyrhizobium sp. AUGA SZCCT0045]